MAKFANERSTNRTIMHKNCRFIELENKLQARKMRAFDRLFISKVDEAVATLIQSNQASMENVAAALCVSPSKLRRLVQNATGITPAVYIVFLRLRVAVRMLDDYPQNSISATAHAAGFSDPAHFTHTFTRYFGCSPLQYAQEHMSREA